MDKGHEDETTHEGSSLPKRELPRRELLKLGAIGAGVGLPVLLTLVPRRARAEGSWQCVPGSQAGAQGSWSGCDDGRGGGARARDWRTRTDDGFDMLSHSERRAQQGWVFPGSHEWRMRRYEEEEEKRRARGDFARFGSADDWK